MLYLPRIFYSEEHGGYISFHSTLAERINIKRLQISMKEINTMY